MLTKCKVLQRLPFRFRKTQENHYSQRRSYQRPVIANQHLAFRTQVLTSARVADDESPGWRWVCNDYGSPSVHTQSLNGKPDRVYNIVFPPDIFKSDRVYELVEK